VTQTATVAPPVEGSVAGRQVGVLGGMGPAATACFLTRLALAVPARVDQDHPRVIVDSNSRIPDRSAALCDGGPDPLPELLRSLSFLEQAGAELLVMPCVTAHAFLPQLLLQTRVPFVDLVQVVSAHVRALGRGPAALLATDGTLASGVLQRAFKQDGIPVIVPGPACQRVVMQAVRAAKAGRIEDGARALTEAVETMTRSGATTVVLGCTDLCLLEIPDVHDVPLIDPLTLLAGAAVRALTEG
jgi:aspartate racemase